MYKSVDYQYNEFNQLVKRTDSQNQTYTYQYDTLGNRIVETGKKESRAFVYDETNHLVEGTNWKGDKSAYTYNALFVRINNTQTSHSGNVYDRDYVIDYTSLERDDLMIYAEGNGQLDYVQREVYAGSERIEQFTDRSNSGYERTLYVHEDVQGNTRYHTKTNGNSFAELTYDAWGMPVSPNKLLNNDHGNYVYATYTGHIFDTTLDIYFAEARFYDAQTRTWLTMDPIKDGGNWYQYCFSNPVTNWDPTGLSPEESPSGANPKDYNTPYNSCGTSSLKFNPLNGMLAHQLLQKYFLTIFLLSHPNGSGRVEYEVTGYPFSKSGKGKIDIAYIDEISRWEVYEIKPITQKNRTDTLYNGKLTGVGQREGYITALRTMKIEVNKDGRTFNPDKLKLSSSLAPNIVFTYYTTASTGMI